MMNIENLLRVLRGRAPWRTVASPMLRSCGFEVARGYDDTIDEIVKADPDQDVIDNFTERLIEYLIAGEKSLRIYRVTAKQKEALRHWIQNRRVSRSDMTDAFLNIPHLDVLREFDNTAPQYVSRIENDRGLAAIFTTARSYQERVEIARTAVKGINASDFDKIIGVKKITTQVYDAIWVSNNSDVFAILCDYPEKAPRDFPKLSQGALAIAARRALGEELEGVNLWPAIDGLYRARDGQVVDLSFATDNESVKNLKSRRGTQCLRKDTYHHHGASAVGDDLIPYRVAVRWHRKSDKGDLNSSPELLLPGTSRIKDSAMPQLTDGVLRHCIGASDVEFVLGKIAQHL